MGTKGVPQRQSEGLLSEDLGLNAGQAQKSAHWQSCPKGRFLLLCLKKIILGWTPFPCTSSWAWPCVRRAEPGPYLSSRQPAVLRISPSPMPPIFALNPTRAASSLRVSYFAGSSCILHIKRPLMRWPVAGILSSPSH